MQQAKPSSCNLTPLVQVLLGMVQPSAPIPIDSLKYFDPSLNESQKSAVRFALGAAEVALIHGPPGVCCMFSCKIAPHTYAKDA